MIRLPCKKAWPNCCWIFRPRSCKIGFGLTLLALYHYFFILLGILLVILLYLVFKLSYKSGMESSYDESTFKYKVAAWLQEIARNRESFRQEPRFGFALNKNDQFATEYIDSRERHFTVLKRQYIQLIIFKVLVTAALLSLGGFLVISNKMNIGQFVAAEIVILFLISSVEKIIFGLETFYDVLTAAEKIGQVSDMSLIEFPTQGKNNARDIKIEAAGVNFGFPGSNTNSLNDINLEIQQGEKIVVTGNNGAGKSTLLGLLSGVLEPVSGNIHFTDNEICRIESQDFAAQIRSLLKDEKLFEGTIRENILFGEADISQGNLKWALDHACLSPYIKNFPDGLDTKIHPNGKRLSDSDIKKILLARCIMHKPKVLFLEDPTDKMDDETSEKIVKFLTQEPGWTLIIASNKDIWKENCDRMIALENGRIINDSKLNHHA